MRRRMIRKAVSLVLLVSALSTASAVQAEDLPRLAGKVTKVVDGDTIDVKLSSGPIRVRLHGIDTPEKSQPWTKEATAALSELVGRKQVELEPFEQDRYDRLIARVFVGDIDINGELVKRGHAWAYRQYMTKADARYCTFEESARNAKLGLWSLSEPAPPWMYRKFKNIEHWDVRVSAARCMDEIGRQAAPAQPPSKPLIPQVQ